MRTTKGFLIRNMNRIMVPMMIFLLLLSTIVLAFGIRQTQKQEALRIFAQVEQMLEENSAELKQVEREYAAACIQDARAAAHILDLNPSARESIEDLKQIAGEVGVDEIHIFDVTGTIVSGTNPEYYYYNFDSGEQMNFFKPLLQDKTLELVQDIMPNTAEGKQVQYSALWNDDRTYILEVGKYPETVLRAMEKSQLSYIFSLLRVELDCKLYAIGSRRVVGSTIPQDVGKSAAEAGFGEGKLASEKPFYARADGVLCFCLAKESEGNILVYAMPVSKLLLSVLYNLFLLFLGMLLSAVMLIPAISTAVEKTVTEQILQTNEKLREIQSGNLQTEVNVDGSKEFQELSWHINSMVESLVKSSERAKLIEQVKSQNQKLEEQQRRLEEAVAQAKAASKSKSDFLFNMSHDIRTPMNAIRGLTDLALKSEDFQTQQDYLKDIDVASRQLLGLLNNVLEITELENHTVEIEEHLVNAKENLGKLPSLLDVDLKAKNMTCEVEVDISRPFLYIDMTQYSKVFLNIANNAVRYTPDGGSLKIRFQQLPHSEEDRCIMRTVVEDNGIGMSDKFLARAYESFTREQTTTISGVEGVGLGLAISKKLVDLMGGTISLESKQGKGTRVVIEIPHRLGEAPKEEKVEENTSQMFEGRCILLAEDIDINALITTKLLSSRGIEVHRAKDGVECVDMLLKAESGHYDLILMDIQMPNMDGYSATELIRSFADREKAGIPILALTANTMREDCEKAAAAGMDGHIGKPLDAKVLFEKIEQVLPKKSS